jgi:hypothetical protein
MGCFADKWEPYDITPGIVSYLGMTVEYCIGYCSINGYSIAGVQYG